MKMDHIRYLVAVIMSNLINEAICCRGGRQDTSPRSVKLVSQQGDQPLLVCPRPSNFPGCDLSVLKLGQSQETRLFDHNSYADNSNNKLEEML